MSPKLYWTPTGGQSHGPHRAWHICSQGILYQHPNQETCPAPYKAALLPFTSPDASPCIFDIKPVLQARGQRQYLLPTMTELLVAQPLSFELWAPWTMFLHMFTSTSRQLWTTEAHILHMLHLNIPCSLEGHVFQNLGEQGLRRSLQHTLEIGQELYPLLHTKTLGFCVSSSSSLTSNLQTKQAPMLPLKK